MKKRKKKEKENKRKRKAFYVNNLNNGNKKSLINRNMNLGV